VEESVKVSDPSGGRGAGTLRALFAIALLLLVLEPGRIPLFEPDEGRYSEIPREMLATGDWVVPRLNGALYFEKPPLHYWAVATSFRLFGQSENSARLPVKAASVGMAVAAMLFARRRWGARVGFLAGLVTACSALVFAMARITVIDPGLSLAMTLAAFSFVAFFEAEEENDRRRSFRALLGLHVAAAAAVMLKGLIGLVLPGGAIVVWIALTGRWRLVPKLFSPVPLLVFLSLTVPWHVLVARREPSFLNFYFVHEHFDRFLKSEHRRGGHPLYFGAVLLGGFLPWTAFLGRLRETWPGLRLEAWKRRGPEGFLWVWSILVFLFFSASKSKLIPYVEPIWPALAVLLALGIERAAARGASFRGERWATGALLGLLAAAGLVYGFGAGYAARFGVVGPASLAVAALATGSLLQILLAEGLVPGVGRSPREAAAPLAASWLAFFLGAVLALPGVARNITPWPVAEAVLREKGPGDLLLQRGHYLQAVPFYAKALTPVSRLGWHELNFGQSQAPLSPLFPSDEAFAALWNGPQRVLVVTHRDQLKDFGQPPLAARKAVLLAVSPNGKHALLANR
jgi:4-amino-4-deoxy-L-arabinose transferase-like glycosyltransferase